MKGYVCPVCRERPCSQFALRASASSRRKHAAAVAAGIKRTRENIRRTVDAAREAR